MEIKKGMKFTIREDLWTDEEDNDVYSINTVTESKVSVGWKGFPNRTSYSLKNVQEAFEDGSWIVLKTETDAGN